MPCLFGDASKAREEGSVSFERWGWLFWWKPKWVPEIQLALASRGDNWGFGIVFNQQLSWIGLHLISYDVARAQRCRSRGLPWRLYDDRRLGVANGTRPRTPGPYTRGSIYGRIVGTLSNPRYHRCCDARLR